ncbi:MAG: hypothetical protein NUV55_04760 [Sulfuricaulis sp.]|uniref:hypothetical protein n=1 Tax=Sulfuricaulis sp. TaxID=2003553 RepID=UPI0025F0CF5B|nr:hypothetical protein [Sulfuricaulis sp.]MCR4346498.1 hypothetical protein [Sulfuricaulis sp.]
MTENASPSQILMTPPEAAPAAATAAPAPDPVPDLAAVSEADFKSQMSDGGLNPDQLKFLVTNEAQAGRLTQTQADEMLKADGVDSAAPAELGFEPARPEHYIFPKPAGEMTPKDRQADMQLRNWLAGAKFPRDVGSSLAAEARKVIDAHSKMDDNQKEFYKRDQAFKLQSLWKDKFSERMNLARQLLTELDAKQPGILDFIDQSGLGNSAMIINLVSAQAERLSMRKRKE